MNGSLLVAFLASLAVFAFAQKKDGGKGDLQKQVCGKLLETPANLDKAVQCFKNAPEKIMQAWQDCKVQVGQGNLPDPDFVKKGCNDNVMFGKFVDCVVQHGGTSMEGMSAEDQAKMTTMQTCFSDIFGH